MEPSRDDFCHPYQPYDIQLAFMRNLYQCLEQGKVGIFESPTGTGKSLSLICGALTWLRDHARREIDGSFEVSTADQDDWLAAAENAARRREFLLEREEIERKIALLREKENVRKSKAEEARVSKKIRHTAATSESVIKDDGDDYMLDDYISDQDNQNTRKKDGNLSSATQALLDQLKPVARSDEEELQDDRLKLIFCSRTHSQLTQFIHELQRVKPPTSLKLQSGDGTLRDIEEHVKHLTLGSRRNLCINPKVGNLSSTAAINERCLELQKQTTAKTHKCKFLPGKEDRSRVEAFRDRAISNIRDIEDIANLGRSMELCPYYASRSAIPHSEILTLPYPLLLAKSAREALGVQVKGNVVIIDEAHNLMDAIADTLSVSLSLSQLDIATKQITTYVSKFKHRLKGSNRMYVTQLIRLLNSFTSCLRGVLEHKSQSEVAITAAQLMAGKGVDQIKPHRLLEYLLRSKLGHKVEGYLEAHEAVSSLNQSRGILLQFQNFLAVLMNPDAEGRFFVIKQDQDCIVRYTLLDPREHFRDIVEDARAVILAGGTMSPTSDYADFLFSYLNGDRLQTFSFGHVIPATNMMVESVGVTASGADFDFTFGKRDSESIIVALGQVILRVCLTVPDGVVVFFPSYDYLAKVVSIWKQQQPASRPIMDALSSVKTLFEESRGAAVDDLLRDYAEAIDKHKGGLMLSVVGGKLSEGINFSDKLGRAVVAVGLPFPNLHSAEWKAKIEHIEQSKYKQSIRDGVSEWESKSRGKAAGKDFYENACMRAINQSIGRAIRHRNDYAAILLVDRRFSSERIRNKLPQWIRSSMRPGNHNRQWAAIEEDLQRFFLSKM